VITGFQRTRSCARAVLPRSVPRNLVFAQRSHRSPTGQAVDLLSAPPISAQVYPPWPATRIPRSCPTGIRRTRGRAAVDNVGSPPGRMSVWPLWKNETACVTIPDDASVNGWVKFTDQMTTLSKHSHSKSSLMRMTRLHSRLPKNSDFVVGQWKMDTVRCRVGAASSVGHLAHSDLSPKAGSRRFRPRETRSPRASSPVHRDSLCGFGFRE